MGRSCVLPAPRIEKSRSCYIKERQRMKPDGSDQEPHVRPFSVRQSHSICPFKVLSLALVSSRFSEYSLVRTNTVIIARLRYEVSVPH